MAKPLSKVHVSNSRSNTDYDAQDIHKLANVSSVNECYKIETSSQARKTEHMRWRQNVPAGPRWQQLWNHMASRMLPGGLDIKHSPSSNIISIISAVIIGLLSKLQ